MLRRKRRDWREKKGSRTGQSLEKILGAKNTKKGEVQFSNTIRQEGEAKNAG